MLSLPAKLPLPHPHMLADQPVQTWVTSVSLDALQASVADGGIGAELDDLDIVEAWVYPEQGRALDKWAKILREGRKVAVETGDVAMKRFLGACYIGLHRANGEPGTCGLRNRCNITTSRSGARRSLRIAAGVAAGSQCALRVKPVDGRCAR